VIKIDGFEAETVRRMVEFLYTGNYDPAPHQSEASSVSAPSRPNNPADLASDSSWPFHRNDRDEPTNTSHNAQQLIKDSILHHVHASAIADYYDIKGLAKLAHSKIQSAPSGEWDAQALLDATKESLSATNDEALHETMATLVAQNLKGLVAIDPLGDVMGDFGAKVLRKYVQNVEAIETDLRDKTTLLAHSVEREEEARDRADRATARANRILESIGRSLETLRERDNCRNRKCSAEFNCYIEQSGHQPVFTVRCAKCRCRH
jgi:hypothetical protein